MKIIFLDIDGVLNNYSSMAEGTWVQALDHTNWDRKSLDALQSIVDATQAWVVISSSWRKIKPSVVWWNEQFKAAGLNLNCIDITGGSSNGFRGREVAEWCDSVEPLDFVILDDDSDFYPEQPRVWVNGQFGLTQEHATRAIELLNGAEMTPIRCMEEINPPV